MEMCSLSLPFFFMRAPWNVFLTNVQVSQPLLERGIGAHCFSFQCNWLWGKGKGGLLERGKGRGSVENLSAKCVILACILVRICTLMPHLLRKSTRDFWWLEVMIGLMFPFPPSCRERPRFWEKNLWPPLAAWWCSSNFLRAEDKNHTSRH